MPRRPAVADRSLLLLGTARRVGWTRSAAEGRPVDASGEPIPWWTYAAIHFVERQLRGDELVFEYGSGQSTKWLAQRVGAVHSVEHDPTWAQRLAADLPSNVTLLERRCSGDGLIAGPDDEYVAAIRGAPAPDVVVVDGRARLSCVDAACSLATGNELILLDDAHRPAYRPALEQLAEAGFARIDFVGPVPGRTNFSTTSAFFADLDRWGMPLREPYDWGSSFDKT